MNMYDMSNQGAEDDVTHAPTKHTFRMQTLEDEHRFPWAFTVNLWKLLEISNINYHQKYKYVISILKNTDAIATTNSIWGY